MWLWLPNCCCAEDRTAVNYGSSARVGKQCGFKVNDRGPCEALLCLLNMLKHQLTASVIKANPKVHRTLTALIQACGESELHSVIICLPSLSSRDCQEKFRASVYLSQSHVVHDGGGGIIHIHKLPLCFFQVKIRIFIEMFRFCT